MIGAKFFNEQCMNAFIAIHTALYESLYNNHRLAIYILLLFFHIHFGNFSG